MPRMASYRDFFAQNRALMQQAALYLPHPNPTFANPPFEQADFRVLIVRLSPFRDVERSTPHLFLAQAARRALPQSYVDMAFFPPAHDRKRLLDAGIPLLVGTQSWRSPEDFDVILVSNAYSLELINLPYLLRHSGAPLLASARDAAFPPILLGGSNALATQAILTGTGDGVADAIFFGEGEREVETLLQTLSAQRALPKRERLLRAAGAVTGLWVAGEASPPVRKAICPAPVADDLLTAYPLLNGEEASTARLQLNFGCPAFCSFCFEGYDRKPYREVSRPEILAAARRLKLNQGAEAVDLYSFNFNTHADILALFLDLNRLFDRVNFMSQRVDVLALVQGMGEAEVLADKRSFTLGIEGVSRRMRAFLHKSLPDATITSLLARLLRQKIRELKLFYILTGHESEADLAEFREFVRDLHELHRRFNRGVRVVFSFGLLVRMPFTPLRYDRLFLDEAEWRRVIGPVKSACDSHDFEFRLATPWDEYAASQVLALGGYWLCAPVLALAEAGHCYDLALTPGYWDALRSRLAESGHLDEAFLGEKGPGYAFPLEFLEQRVAREYFHKKYRQAVDGTDAGYCLGQVGQAGDEAHCLACDACRDPSERAAILQHAMRYPAEDYLRTLESVMHAKRRLKPLYAWVWLPPETAGADPEWLHAYLLRSFLRQYPDLREQLLSAQESLFATKDQRRRYAGLYGETVCAFKAWDVEVLQSIVKEETASGVRFLGWVNDFTPGAFSRIELRFRLPTAHFPDAANCLRKFLQAEYVPVNLRRNGDGYVLDIPEKARKKKVIFEGELAQDGPVCVGRLVVSPKFDWVSYLRAFPDSERWREAQAEVTRLEL